MRAEIVRRLVWLISVAGWAAVLMLLFLTAYEYQGEYYKIQWDFDVCYYAAKAHSVGLNPYDPSQLRELAGVESEDPRSFLYSYLPLSIFLFKPFTWLSVEHANYAYFLIKCALLLYLFFLWQINFMENPSDPFFLVFCLLAFNATIFLDIQSGNVSIIEQALIWSALVGFVKRRMWHFCIFVLLAGIFKITPLLFAGLLLLDEFSPRNRWVLILIYGIIIVGFLNWFTVPSLFREFLSNASHHITVEERFFLNITNPSTLSLVTFLSEELSRASGISVPRAAQWCLYLAVAIPVFVVSCHAFRRLDMAHLEHRKIAVCLACLTYALVMPRFQDYQWILLIVPTYIIMLQLDFVRAYPVIFIFAVLSAAHQMLPGSAFVFEVFWNYYPLVVAITVWALYLKKIQRDSNGAASRMSST
jgi:hypothetical protein